MTQGFNTTNRPGQDAYQTAFDNKGKYGSSNRRPYINPDVPMYVPQDGQNCIRVIDPIELIALKTYFMDVYFHRNVGYKNDYFICDKEHGRGPCPSCEMVTNELWEQDKDMAKELSPEMRRLLWVLDLQKPQEANILKLWSCPRTLSDEILTQSRRPDQNVFVDIAHPATGVPVFFNRAGSGLTTKYTGVQLGEQAYPVDESIAYQRFEFNDILMWHEYSEFADLLAGGVGGAGSPGADQGAYQTGNSTPADQMGAADAAAASKAPPTPPTGAGADAGAGAGDIDYSDLDRINPDNKDCFRNNYDQYNECDTCGDKELCGQPWPVAQAKAQKPGKSAKAPKRVKPGATGGAGGTPPTPPTPPGNAGGPPNANGGGNKILDAQAKLRAEIEARKNG